MYNEVWVYLQSYSFTRIVDWNKEFGFLHWERKVQFFRHGNWYSRHYDWRHQIVPPFCAMLSTFLFSVGWFFFQRRALKLSLSLSCVTGTEITLEPCSTRPCKWFTPAQKYCISVCSASATYLSFCKNLCLYPFSLMQKKSWIQNFPTPFYPLHFNRHVQEQWGKLNLPRLMWTNHHLWHCF